jgi:hypothetical protein
MVERRAKFRRHLGVPKILYMITVSFPKPTVGCSQMLEKPLVRVKMSVTYPA